jgi:release factor glutamine methyltransferase
MGEWDQLFEHPDYEVEINGLKLLVRNGVFTPDPTITYSSKQIIDNLPKVRGKSVMDMGTGSGVIALYCASQGANVVATDVSDVALDNAEENVKELGLEDRVQVVKSDLFEAVDGKFDYVVANLPINDNVWDMEQSTTNLVGRFLSQAPEYLNPNGKLYLAWASFSDIQPVKALCASLDYNFKLTSEEKLGHTWHLFEVSF